MNQEEFVKRYGHDMRHPPLSLLLTELKIPLQVLGTFAQWRQLPREPIGKGSPVLLLPGYGAHVKLMGAMKRYLTELGFDARNWCLGVNHGDLKTIMPAILEQVQALASDKGEPVQMVGWSLGGVVAREVARELGPTVVKRVVTLGSPVVGGPKFTAFLPMYKRRGIDVEKAAATVLARYQKPIETEVLALYTAQDAIVAADACIDKFSPNIKHIEVDTTHMSMACSAEIFKILFEELAKPSKPFKGNAC